MSKATQIELFFLFFILFLNFFFEDEVTRVGVQTRKDWEVNVIEVHDVKFPDNQ